MSWSLALVASGLLVMAIPAAQGPARVAGQEEKPHRPSAAANQKRAARRQSARELRELRRKQAQWRRTAARLASWLQGRNRLQRAQALQELERIRDPLAVAPLVKIMERLSVPNQVLVVRALGGIADKRAYRALAVIGMKSRWAEVRSAALEVLEHLPEARAEYVRVFEHELLLEAKKYFDDYLTATRILFATRELDIVELVPALIDLLVTLLPDGWRVDWAHVIILYPGGGGSATTAWKATPVKKPVFHKEVVETLKYLTGQDFGYDQQAWRQWWSKYGGELVARRRAERERARLKAAGSVHEAFAPNQEPPKQ